MTLFCLNKLYNHVKDNFRNYVFIGSLSVFLATNVSVLNSWTLEDSMKYIEQQPPAQVMTKEAEVKKETQSVEPETQKTKPEPKEESQSLERIINIKNIDPERMTCGEYAKFLIQQGLPKEHSFLSYLKTQIENSNDLKLSELEIVGFGGNSDIYLFSVFCNAKSFTLQYGSGNLENLDPNVFRKAETVVLDYSNIIANLENLSPTLFENTIRLSFEDTHISGNLENIHPDLFGNIKYLNFINTKITGNLENIHPDLFRNAEIVGLSGTKVTGPSTGIDPKFKGYIFKD